jgi:surface antigen
MIVTRSARRWGVLLVFTLTLASLLQMVGIAPASASYGNTYTTSINGCKVVSTGVKVTTCNLAGSAQDYYYDPWLEENRECVSYTAWQLSNVFGVTASNWGSGKDWNSSALAAGYTDDPSPQVGDIAQWNATTTNSYGHVAYVYAVNNGVASYAEYNYAYDGNYLDTYTSASTSQGTPNNWIHVGTPGGGGSYTDGSYLVTPSGAVYIVAGGAAVPVHSWASVGGSQSTISVAQSVINSMPKTPANGSYVYVYGSGSVYEFVGGAPVPVTSWASVGGSKTTAEVPSDAIPNDFQQYPTDGTFVTQYGSSSVYVFAVGSAVPVYSWASVGGSQPTTTIPSGAIPTDFLATPGDTGYVYQYGSSSVYEFVGGAPVPVYSWASVGGSFAAAMIPSGAIPTDFPQYPANGTYVYQYGSSSVYEFAGGAPLPVYSWASVGGSQPTEMIPSGAIPTDFSQYPADSTYILEYNGSSVNVTAGGAALRIVSWSDVGGEHPVTIIPTGSIAGSLLSYPRDGTYVIGYGSGEEFLANGGAVTRVTTTPLPPATVVDDWAIINQLGGTE